jgi:hypothetical protein
MGFLAAVKSVFQPKTPVHKSERFMPFGKQHDLINKFSSIFDLPGSKIDYIAIHTTEVDAEIQQIHVIAIGGQEKFIAGIHFDNQKINSFTWTQPWDENENASEGKANIKANGVSFQASTKYVESVMDAFDEFSDAFNFDPLVEQLQFNRSNYWIAKL